LSGRPLIWHVFNRLKPSKFIINRVLATTTNPNDDVLAKWAQENEIPCCRGSEADVLGRFYQSATTFAVDIIVRITADDPFKDAAIIDEVIALFLSKKLDFAYNNNPPTFPEGLDVEVFSRRALKEANEKSIDPFEREHVTQFLYRHPEAYKQDCLVYRDNLSHLRLTVDTPKDLEMARIIYNKLFQSSEFFAMKDILELIAREPEIAAINSAIERSAMYSKKSEAYAKIH